MSHKQRSKHKSHRRHEESSQAEWIWDDDAQSHYRPYTGPDGRTYSEWAEPGQDVTGHDKKPRHSHSSSVDRITKGFANMSHETYEAQATEGGSYTHEPRGKGKGKSVQQEYVDEQHDVVDGSYSQAGSYYQESGDIGPSPGDMSADDYGRGITSHSFASSSHPASYSNPHTTDHTESTDDYSGDTAEVLAAVAGYNYDAYSADSYPGMGESSAMGTDYDYDDHEQDEGAVTPRATGPDEQLELFDELDEGGLLDPRYRVQPSSAFYPGAIFMVYWVEPKGHGKGGGSSSFRSYENKLGGKFYYGIRRFVVVANDQGHASVVPIMTYGRQACKKKGVKPNKHGIIYQSGHKARPLDKEPRLGFAPVRAEITEEGERLAKESRINYSKITAVEHNFRVLFIGNIHAKDWDTFSDAVNECWEAKTHHRRKHRR